METTESYSTRAAARRLGVDERTVRRWIRGGVLPARRLPGGQARIPVTAVAAISDGERRPVADRLNQRDDHACFGCGRLNPFGLRLNFEADGEGVRTDFVPGWLREGWTGTTHGGIVATVLDEVLAWALFRQGIWAVTARLAVTYRQPVPVGNPLSAHGRVVRDRGRLVEAAGEVRDPAGTVLASPDMRAKLERIYGVAEAPP